MAETKPQQAPQQQQEHPEKNNAPPPSRNANVAANNGTNAANNAQGPRMLIIEGLKVNPPYFRTIPGILKIIEWFLGIICIACGAPALFSAVNWFLFVVVICFIFTFVWMCVHFFTVTTVLPKVPWLLMELIYTGSATVLYFIAMVVMLQQTDENKLPLQVFYGKSRWETYIVAGVFALFNTAAYAVETAFHFRAWVDSRRE